MENKKLTLNLIRNTYEVDEAKNIINQLLRDKITFIQNQLFGLQERFGVDSPFMRNRLKELNEAKEQLEQFLKEVNAEDKQVKINCPINIELVASNFSQKKTINNENKSWI